MRTLQGTIVSKRMAKTLVVRVDRLRPHSKYRKYYRVSRKYKVHADDTSPFGKGDVVRFVESRPISKEKRWKVAEIVKRAVVPETYAETAESEN